MIRHIVMWNYKDGFTDQQNAINAERVKSELESLANLDGEVSLKIEINPLPTGNRDIILNSLFESDATLSDYQMHPEHKRASGFVASVTQNRACIDYVE